MIRSIKAVASAFLVSSRGKNEVIASDFDEIMVEMDFLILVGFDCRANRLSVTDFPFHQNIKTEFFSISISSLTEMNRPSPAVEKAPVKDTQNTIIDVDRQVKLVDKLNKKKE